MLKSKSMFAILFVMFCFLISTSKSTTFTILNSCSYTVWPGILSGAGTSQLSTTGFVLNSGESTTVSIPISWSGRLWGRTHCTTDPVSNKFTCLTGDCGSNELSCSGAGATPPATLVEFTLNGANNLDFYDVSLVDGYNLPILISPSSKSTAASNCTATGCAVDLNSACPNELKVTSFDGSTEGVACKSACEAFGDEKYCCSGAYATPDTCQPSVYSEMFKSACPRAYSYAYDDGTSTFTCNAGGDYVITFCPTPANRFGPIGRFGYRWRISIHRARGTEAVVYRGEQLSSEREREREMMESHATRGIWLYVSVLLCYVFPPIASIVVLKPYPISFFHTPARFSMVINSSGICGALYVADPQDGCSQLKNSFRYGSDRGDVVRIVLIRRGNCVFEDKVRNAQLGGYQAAIVYDDKENRSPVSMVGNSKGIHIYAIFVSNTAGVFLRDYASGQEGECCITPSIEDAAWTVLWISIISLFVILCVFASLLIARYRRLYLQHSSHHLPVIDVKSVNVLPSVLFNSSCPHGRNARETCSICLEDYKDGENLRVLPCEHDFHAKCVDSWLTRWAAFCPICKLNMKN